MQWLHLLIGCDKFKFFVVYTNEEDNDVADKAMEVVLDYIKRNSKLGLKVDIRKVSGNRTDTKGMLDNCKFFCLFCVFQGKLMTC